MEIRRTDWSKARESEHYRRLLSRPNRGRSRAGGVAGELQVGDCRETGSGYIEQAQLADGFSILESREALAEPAYRTVHYPVL